MLLNIKRLAPFISRNSLLSLRNASFSRESESAPKFSESGYEVSEGVVRSEEVRDLWITANRMMNSSKEHKSVHHNTHEEAAYLYFSGGHDVNIRFINRL